MVIIDQFCNIQTPQNDLTVLADGVVTATEVNHQSYFNMWITSIKKVLCRYSKSKVQNSTTVIFTYTLCQLHYDRYT